MSFRDVISYFSRSKGRKGADLKILSLCLNSTKIRRTPVFCLWEKTVSLTTYYRAFTVEKKLYILFHVEFRMPKKISIISKRF